MDGIYFSNGEFDEAACWEAVLRRDDDAGAAFLFGVITTAIFCRPSCPARRPKRENLRLFRDVASARRAGFRACKRCRPEQSIAASPQVTLVRELCDEIAQADEMPSLDQLASKRGISATHLHRLFKAATGLTPKAYMAALKAGRIREALPFTETVTQAVYEAGYGSSSRFYERAGDVLGMMPSDYRAGGKGASMTYAIERCWLGLVLVAATERGICAIQFGDDEAELAAELHERFHSADIQCGGDDFNDRLAEVVAAIEQPYLARQLPLDIRGTVFQHRIWAALREIPPGKTASYKEVAEGIGEPKAVRAVARACAANPVAIAVPCHRVVRSDGGISGYRWGVERKRKLLEREAGGERQGKTGKPTVLGDRSGSY
jgi:AraC family transcriptional regulator of adaptative response/methylated-DNA-[protein]-cysteine methyltransferase